MAQIYSNAYITILASNASDAAHGFLAHRDALDASSARIPFRIAPNKFGSVTARRCVSRSLSKKLENPLSTRAWALQEQMMASRILAYTKHTLEWRCASGMMNLNNSLNIDFGYEPKPKLISQLSKVPDEALWEWIRIVEDYSNRSMSIRSDKLPAIAALAEKFAAVLGHYYAGLWRYGLIKQLCWRLMHCSQEQRAGNPYRAPSWSWASVNGNCTWFNYAIGEEDCCNMESAEIVPKNVEIPYGEMLHASIKICGKVYIASIGGVEDFQPMRTLICYESVVAEPPLQRFYKTYFHQHTKSAAPSRGSAFIASVYWDCKEFRSDPSIVREFLLIPITSGKQL